MRSGKRDWTRAERGVAFVELALVMPILTILLLGVLQFGFVLKEHQIVHNAAREGARLASQIADREPGQVTGAVRELVALYLDQEGMSTPPGFISVEQVEYAADDVWTCGSRVTVRYVSSTFVGSGFFGDFTITAEAFFRNLISNPC